MGGAIGGVSGGLSGGENEDETGALIRTIRRRIGETLGPEGASSAARVKEVFADIDGDNSGAIDKTELAQALKVTERGGVCCAVLSYPVPSCAVLSFAKLSYSLSHCFVLFRSFESHSSSPTPFPHPPHPPQVLRIATSQQELDLLFDRFDDTRRGMLDYHSYLELLGFKKAAAMERRRYSDG